MKNKLIHLMYVSSACESFSTEQLRDLLVSAREKNKTIKITGMLVHKGGNFLQLLEGEKEDVLALFDSILRDKRHKDVIKILQRKTQQRYFPDWSMGFLSMEEEESLPVFDDYMSDILSREQFRQESKFVYEYLKTFNQLNLH